MTAEVEDLGVGVLGCGFVSRRHHLPALAAAPGVRCVALADPDPGALSWAAALAPGARRVGGLDALLADPAVGVVAVCTPTDGHAAAAIAALGAGRHVLVEKPPALTLADVDAIATAAHAAGRTVGVGLAYRFHRLVRRARELVAAGALGPVQAIQTTMTSDSVRHPERARAWRADPARGGGVLLELGTHQVDLWRFVTGADLEELQAPVTSGATAALAGRLAGGIVAATVLGEDAGRNHELRVYGRDATLVARLDRFDGLTVLAAGELPGDPAVRMRRAVQTVRASRAMLRSRREGGDLAAAMRDQWAALARAIRTGAAYTPGLAEGRAALDAVLDAVAAAEARAVPA